jgi:hypothetical protein
MVLNLAKKKSKTKDEKNWLNRISNFGCVVCRKHYEIDDAPPANCHHIRQGMGAGQKNSHYMVLPLCHHHHQGQDGFHSAPKTWQKKYGTESELLEWVLDNMEG